MRALIEQDDVMTDAIRSVHELSEAVRSINVHELHRSVRSWVYDQPEHAVIMLIAAACVVDPDEHTVALRDRLRRVMIERSLVGVA